MEVTAVVWTVALSLAVFALLLAVWVKMAARRASRPWLPEESSYLCPKTGKETPFTSTLYDAPSLFLSVIVPAFNEEDRILKMLNLALMHLRRRAAASADFSFEVIVVDDGSSDRTTDVVRAFAATQPDDVRVLRLLANRGKGGAVKRGMLFGRGQYLLFVDADGATNFEDLDVVLARLQAAEAPARALRRAGGTHGVAVGSRAHLEEGNVKRKLFRRALSFVFHLLRAALCVRGVADTQCGFKLFCRDTARLVFPIQHVERWAFDVELLFLATQYGVPIVEVPVRWEEIDGSKISPLQASVQMARDIVRIRLMYLSGVWAMPA